MNRIFLLTETQNADITFGEALIVSVTFVAIVFGMLALLWGIIALFKLFNKKQQIVQESEVEKIKLEDIQDEDMMAAVLVAMIDYHNETKLDVCVTSVKRIG